MDFVGRLTNWRGQIYVFCALGCNRSVAVVIALLMAIEGLTLDAALALVRQRRPAIRPKLLSLHIEDNAWYQSSAVLTYIPVHMDIFFSCMLPVNG